MSAQLMTRRATADRRLRPAVFHCENVAPILGSLKA